MNTNSFIKNNTTTTLNVGQLSKPERIDIYVAQQFQHYSRSFFQNLIKKECVKINNILITKPSTLIHAGNTISLHFPQEEKKTIHEKGNIVNDISTIYTHEHFIIINKPAGILVHPPSQSSKALSVTDWIEYHHAEIKHIGLIDRPGIVHRLDKETSGLLIIARTHHAYHIFSNLFKKREIQKSYLAVVSGHPDKEGLIDYAIGRDPHNRIRMKAFINDSIHNRSGTIRASQTNYFTLNYFANPDTSLIKINPVTGRTHQIRVHMTSIGHPLIGDQLYGKKSPFIDRHALHAHALSFTFDGIPYFFTAEIPKDLQKLINRLSSHTIDFE